MYNIYTHTVNSSFLKHFFFGNKVAGQAFALATLNSQGFYSSETGYKWGADREKIFDRFYGEMRSRFKRTGLENSAWYRRFHRYNLQSGGGERVLSCVMLLYYYY